MINMKQEKINKYKRPVTEKDMGKNTKIEENLGLKLNPESIYSGIVMSEILGKPRAYKKRIR